MTRHRMGEWVPCAYCGELVYRKPSRLTLYSHTFCSLSCVWKFENHHCKEKYIIASARRRKKVNLQLTGTLAYIVGVLLGDGSVEKSKTVSLKVKDSVFAECFADALRKLGMNVSIRETYDGKTNHNILYRARGYSQTFVEWWHGLSRESVNWIAFLYPQPILKGFYESEGNYNSRDCCLNFSNTKKVNILMASNALNSLGFHPTICGPYIPSPPRQPWYSLRLNRQEETSKFLRLVKPVIKGAR